MSQMGRVINAVRKLFNHRDEMLLAKTRDETLFAAAAKFNDAIDDFEQRESRKDKK